MAFGVVVAGSIWVDWPGVCKHLGMDPELSGPVIMGVGQNPEGNCPWGHPKGSPKHKRPMVKGKPFDLKDYKEELTKLGLTTFRPELKAEAEAGKNPPGTPKKVGSTLVYPARHF
jgi:hypothetical protein